MLLHEMHVIFMQILWFSYARALRRRKLLLWHFSYHQCTVDQVVFIISSFIYVLALGLADEKEVGCLRHFVMSSTS